MQNKAQVATMILAMAENFNQEISKARMGLIMESLAPFDDQAIGEAVKRILRTSRFFPTVADLLDAIEGKPEDALALEAEHQWKQLWVAADKGAWFTFYAEDNPGPADYLNPTALLVLQQMGGRGAMLEWKEADLHWRRKEWTELYKAVHGSERVLVEGPAAVKELTDKIKGLPEPKDGRQARERSGR